MLWTVVVVLGFFLPAEAVRASSSRSPCCIGIVLGGTQALSRSLYSQLIPRGREAEYFSLYQACERGTSWFGTLLFGAGLPVHRLLPLGDRRARSSFFVLGGVPARTGRMREGIVEAGNPVPAVV